MHRETRAHPALVQHFTGAPGMARPLRETRFLDHLMVRGPRPIPSMRMLTDRFKNV